MIFTLSFSPLETLFRGEQLSLWRIDTFHLFILLWDVDVWIIFKQRRDIHRHSRNFTEIASFRVYFSLFWGGWGNSSGTRFILVEESLALLTKSRAETFGVEIAKNLVSFAQPSVNYEKKLERRVRSSTRERFFPYSSDLVFRRRPAASHRMASRPVRHSSRSRPTGRGHRGGKKRRCTVNIVWHVTIIGLYIILRVKIRKR